MEERTYTQKQLYEFVTEYSREAREEGFDMSVGDFVDWVASRDEKDENRYIDPKILDMGRKLAESMGMDTEEEEDTDEPVLPEKLELSRYGMNANDEKVEHKVNEILTYLKERIL